MKLLYKTVSGAGDYILLYDEGAIAVDFDPAAQTPGSMPVWKPEFQGVKQEDNTFTTPGGIVPRFRQPLGNVEAHVQASFHVGYASRAEAIAAVRTYSALMQQLIHFQLIQDAEIQYYPNAVVDTYSAEPQGVDVIHSFSFTSDLVTDQEP